MLSFSSVSWTSSRSFEPLSSNHFNPTSISWLTVNCHHSFYCTITRGVNGVKFTRYRTSFHKNQIQELLRETNEKDKWWNLAAAEPHCRQLKIGIANGTKYRKNKEVLHRLWKTKNEKSAVEKSEFDFNDPDVEIPPKPELQESIHVKQLKNV